MRFPSYHFSAPDRCYHYVSIFYRCLCKPPFQNLCLKWAHFRHCLSSRWFHPLSPHLLYSHLCMTLLLWHVVTTTVPGRQSPRVSKSCPSHFLWWHWLLVPKCMFLSPVGPSYQTLIHQEPPGTTRNTMSWSYPATSLTCSLTITNPKGHVHQPPSPTRCRG